MIDNDAEHKRLLALARRISESTQKTQFVYWDNLKARWVSADQAPYWATSLTKIEPKEHFA